MFYKMLLLVVVILTSSSVLPSESIVITMGYKTTQKAPYINQAPDNNGLYYELYSEAAKRIGAELKIVRMPKVHILIHRDHPFSCKPITCSHLSRSPILIDADHFL